ncbi:TadE/TadG family type IV pilus assembly protein [Roseiflexus sp.]|uniref:TadE/TadG family type IV pilus assembly protein n=1 Tax=Roseiflexus sp. TaxID=2562120 RepID=UPI00398A88B7
MMQQQKQVIRAVSALVRNERGAAIIEYIGFFPLVLLVLVIAWQFVLVGYTGIIAAGAAREGARAAATREDVDRAVRNASPGFDGRRWWRPLAGYPCSDYSSHPVTIQVQLEVPHVLFPFVGSLGSYPKVTQRATVRCEPPPIARIDVSPDLHTGV